jgi:hypothetical protein
MQMVGQYHPSMNRERAMSAQGTDNAPETIDVAKQQVIAAALEQIHGEEPSAAWLPGSAIVRHIPCLENPTYGAMPFGYCPTAPIFFAILNLIFDIAKSIILGSEGAIARETGTRCEQRESAGSSRYGKVVA